MRINQKQGTPGMASVADVTGISLDPDRGVWLNDHDESACRAALAGLANGAGGQAVLVGVWEESDVARLAKQVDPPLTGLISTRVGVFVGAGEAAIVDVHQSPYCPHIDAVSGIIYEHNGRNIVPVTSRTGLDRLYRKGRAADERAQRSIDGMIERMQLASFGHFGLAVLACLRLPSAEPYLWAVGHPDELATQGDPFTAEWALSPAMLRVRPGDVELRGERDVSGVVRVTRAGCVAVGETRRKPQGEVLGTPEELRERLRILLGTACRVLGRYEGSVIVPRLLCEGLRATRLSADAEAFKPATVDTLDASGEAGHADDAAYQKELVQELTERLLALYAVEPGP